VHNKISEQDEKKPNKEKSRLILSAVNNQKIGSLNSKSYFVKIQTATQKAILSGNNNIKHNKSTLKDKSGAYNIEQKSAFKY